MGDESSQTLRQQTLKVIPNRSHMSQLVDYSHIKDHGKNLLLLGMTLGVRNFKENDPGIMGFKLTLAFEQIDILGYFDQGSQYLSHPIAEYCH